MWCSNEDSGGVFTEHCHIRMRFMCAVIECAACVSETKRKGASGTIEVLAYEKKGKFFLQIVNSCDDDIPFKNGVPVTGRPGHGTGVRSICAIVEKYGGIYTYSANDGKFILRVSL